LLLFSVHPKPKGRKVDKMLTLKKVKELVGAPSHAKRTPSPKMLYEEGIVLLRREFDQGSHLTVYNSGYVLFSAGKRNTVFHNHYNHSQKHKSFKNHYLCKKHKWRYTWKRTKK
jgi:hypothetical protein